MKTSLSALIKGDLVFFKNQLWKILTLSHSKLGRGRGLVKVGLKNLQTKQSLTQVFRSDEEFEKIQVENKELIFLYQKSNEYFFMDQNDFKEIKVSGDNIEAAAFLFEGMNVKAKECDNEIVAIELPAKIEAEITKTVPGVKGNSKESADKAAFLSNGTQIQVPLFIKEGERVIIDQNGKYLSRAG